MKSSKVLVSILNWNAPDNTINTVKSVLLSNYSDYSILILDNNSTDDSEARLVSAFREIPFLKMKSNIGYAGAHKVAARIAMSEHFDLLWILNNDVEVFPDTLLELVKTYQARGECLLGSVAIGADRETIVFAGGLEPSRNGFFDGNSHYNQYRGKKVREINIQERIVSDLQGSSFLMPVNVIRKYGFMNTRFFLYGEETEYCFRLRRDFGVPSVIVPTSIVIHAGGGTFLNNKKLNYIREYYSTRNGNLVQFRFQKEIPVHEMRISRIPFYFKFFLRHFFMVTAAEKDYQYWLNYYRELGSLHSICRIKGKYLAPEKFLG